jgi:hypothetical protein
LCGKYKASKKEKSPNLCRLRLFLLVARTDLNRGPKDYELLDYYLSLTLDLIENLVLKGLNTGFVRGS